jgi:hypothetical protein
VAGFCFDPKEDGVLVCSFGLCGDDAVIGVGGGDEYRRIFAAGGYVVEW